MGYVLSAAEERATFGIFVKWLNITIYPINCVPKMVFRNVTVQTVFRIVSAVTIRKTVCGIEYDMLCI